MATHPEYLIHFACVFCRRSFKRDNRDGELLKSCPNCSQIAINLGRHFKPPRAADLEAWAVVRFLVRRGFLFQHVRDANGYVKYPRNLQDAEEFVVRYSDQAIATAIPEIREALSAV